VAYQSPCYNPPRGEARTQDVDHGPIEHLEHGQQVQHQQPEDRDGDFVFRLVVHDLRHLSHQLTTRRTPAGAPTSHLSRAVSWYCTTAVSLNKPLSTVSFSRRDSLPRTQSHLVSRKAFARSDR